MAGGQPTARIGLWGTYDVENYGDVLFPQILRAELTRRIPGASVRAFSPLGFQHPNRFDGGRPSEPLGPYGPERVAELVGELDCVLVGPGEIVHSRDDLLAPHYGLPPEDLVALAPSRFFIEGLGPELERDCPVVWLAVGIPFDLDEAEARTVREAVADRPYLGVREEHSRERLKAAGVEREVEVVPDPAFLLPRIFPEDVLERRVANLRALGWFPDRGRPVLLHAPRSFLPHVESLGATVGQLRERADGGAVVLVETGPIHGDGEFAAALAQSLGGSVLRAEGAGLEDLVAAVWGSAGFVGVSLHGNITAAAFGRPHVVLGFHGDTKLTGFAEVIGLPECLATDASTVSDAFDRVSAAGPRPQVVADLQGKVDAALDRIAAIAKAAAGRRGTTEADAGPAQVEDRIEALRRAHRDRGRLLALQRWRMADRVTEAEARERHTREELEARITDLEGEQVRLKAEVEGKDRELRTLLATRTFRYTVGLRRLWGRVRGWFRR